MSVTEGAIRGAQRRSGRSQRRVRIAHAIQSVRAPPRALAGASPEGLVTCPRIPSYLGAARVPFGQQPLNAAARTLTPQKTVTNKDVWEGNETAPQLFWMTARCTREEAIGRD